MNFNRYLIFIFCLNFIFSQNYTYKDLPILESGRIKPFGTFAENQLLVLYGKRSFKTDTLKVDAIDWMLDIASNPEQRVDQKVFYLSKWDNSPDVEISLGLASEDHYYSYQDIFEGLSENRDLIVNLLNSSEDERTVVDNQIINVYKKWDLYDKISNGLIVLLPLVDVENDIIKDYLSTSKNKVSYSFLIRNLEKFKYLFKQLIEIDEKEWNEVHEKTAQIFNEFQNIEYVISQHQSSFDYFKIIPPDMMDTDEWLSPLNVLLLDRTDNQNKLLESYENFFHACVDNNVAEMNLYSNSIIGYISDIDKNFKPNLLSKESKVKKIAPFQKSMLFYLLSFIVLLFSWNKHSHILRKIALVLLFSGFLFHGYGLILRMIILQRPPVSTLYESILFVNFILVLFAMLFENFRKDKIGILIASFGGVFLHYIGLKYASDGDTLGMLVAVLNSNFWLATHVTTITVGYGVSLVAGMMGHVYMLMAFFVKNNKSDLKKINNNIYGLTLMALFFTMFGTILGGIWADQSWGRFWGWDPKENGALLIVLWLLMMLHMRLSGIVKALGFAFGISLINIIVAIAWFGVNLLSVGLHSYGFTDNVATNLFAFISIEIVFCSTLYFLIKKKNISLNEK